MRHDKQNNYRLTWFIFLTLDDKCHVLWMTPISNISGISAKTSFILALLCSYVMMSLGYLIGGTFRSQWIESQANVIAGAIFGFLGNLQILDCIQ